MTLSNLKPFIKKTLAGMMALFLTLPGTISADQSAGTTGADFLKLGVGARYIAMGKAATAVANDAYALFWNQAFLGSMEAPHLTAMYGTYVESINYQYLAYASPFGELGSFGVSMQNVSLGVFDQLNALGQKTGEYAPRDTSIMMGWGRRFFDHFLWGAGINYIRSKIVNSASTFAFDTGIGYEWNQWHAGMTLKNMGAGLKYNTETDPLPQSFQTGVSYHINPDWIASFDIDQTKGSPRTWGLGTEYGWDLQGEDQKLFLRGGYQSRSHNVTGLQGTTLGFGWQWSATQLDYAWAPMGDLQEHTHRFSFSFRFATKQDADQDGVEDKKDTCPNTILGQKVNAEGCADTDQDGIPNNRDKCTKTPKGEKVNNIGCSDSDKDGITNDIDLCPNTKPGIKVNRSGCFLDTDQDGIPDGPDQCPGTPLEIHVDKTGCPAIPPQDVEWILKGIEFKSGSSELGEKSWPILNATADALLRDESIHIEIGGHTDSVGRLKSNMRLSKKRAQAVKTYLRQRGVISSRMKIKGYGPKLPITTNKTKEGRAKNRRIEFKILKMSLQKTPARKKR